MISTLDITFAPEETTAHDHESALSRTGASAPAQFFIPLDEAVKAAQEGVPVEVLQETRLLLNIMAQIHAAPKKRPECERQAKLCANKWSAETLKAKYYQYVGGCTKGGRTFEAFDWRSLLNVAKAPAERKKDTVLKYAFYEFWRKLGEQNQRCWSAAHTELIQIWRTGFGFPHGTKRPQRYTKIPGYMTWPEADPATGIPEGWNYATLMRYKSDPTTTTAARVGRGKASLQRLPVLTTRVGLKFMQYVEFDDHEFNQKVMFQKRPMRPLGFGAVEVLSDCLCHIGMKPTIWDVDEERKRKLTEQEFMWFVISFLCTIGYRNDSTGTELIVERGTAAIRDAFRERIEKVFHGRVSVFNGGRMGKAAHDGQFEGRSHGNFKTKALMESMWNPVDNQMATLSAQTGKDRDHAPEQLHGIEHYTQSLIRRAERENLPMERRALLELPIAPFFQWREWALDAVKRINDARNHAIEGWDKLGFVVPEWKLDAGIRKAICNLPADQQKMVLQGLLSGNPDLATEQRMTRQEVFNIHRREISTAPLELIPQLVGIEHALNGGGPIEVKKGLLTFEDSEIDSEPLEFYAMDAKRKNSYLPNGEKYICFANPYDPRALIACEANGSGNLRVVATCPRYERPCRADEKAVLARIGEQNAWESAIRQKLNLRHADTAADIDAMRAHNERVFNGAPITPAEKVKARQANARKKALQEYQPDVSELADTPKDLQTPTDAPGTGADELSPEGLL